MSTTDNSVPADVPQRRREFVNHLYTLYQNLESGNRHVAAPARAELAVLRRSFVDSQEMDAYERVFEFDPPEREQRVWLLVAGLFALHPQSWAANGGKQASVGAAMGKLARDREGAVKRRFRQLTSVDGTALEHHLRQSIQLLRGAGIPLDYELLLADLTTLLASDPHSYRSEQRQRVRLRWAREFHRASRTADADNTLEENK